MALGSLHRHHHRIRRFLREIIIPVLRRSDPIGYGGTSVLLIPGRAPEQAFAPAPYSVHHRPIDPILRNLKIRLETLDKIRSHPTSTMQVSGSHLELNSVRSDERGRGRGIPS
jgi:hypothetical protein